MDAVFDRLRQPITRWLMALTWTVLLLVFLLQSSSQPLVGPAAPLGPPTLEREIILAVGHIVGFAVLTGLWWWALRLASERALVVAMIIALVIGTVTELAQATMPDRSASVFDLLVNGLTTFGTAWIIQRKRLPMRTLLSQVLMLAALLACTLTTVPPQTPTPEATDEPVFIDARDNPDVTDDVTAPNDTATVVQPPAEFYIPGCVPRTDWQLYTVKDGDIITNLAVLGEITVDELVAGNCLANPDLLYVGQVIYVPPAFPPTPEPAG